MIVRTDPALSKSSSISSVLPSLRPDMTGPPYSHEIPGTMPCFDFGEKPLDATALVPAVSPTRSDLVDRAPLTFGLLVPAIRPGGRRVLHSRGAVLDE